MKNHDSLACLRIMQLLLKICKIANRVEVVYGFVICDELVSECEFDESFCISCNYGTSVKINHVHWVIPKSNVIDCT